MSDASKSTLSLASIATCLAVIFPMLWWVRGSYDEVIAGQQKEAETSQQILLVLESHGKTLDTMKARTVQVYPHRWDFDEEKHVWLTFKANNPSLTIPEYMVERVHEEYPPQPPPMY